MSAGRLFDGRNTAQHPAAVIANKNNNSLDPIRAKKTFIGEKLDLYCGFGY